MFPFMTLCVTTAFNDRYAEMGAVCAETLRAFADHHDLALRVMTTLPDTGRPPAWAKLKVIEALFDDGASWVLWVDTDAVIVRPEADILADIGDGVELALVKHSLSVQPMPGMMVTLEVPNTGVMLLRNSPWTRALLSRAWALSQYTNHKWWENAALIHLMGYHRLLRRQAINAPDPEVMAHVHWLDPAWNSIPDDTATLTRPPIIRHHTRATSYEERVAAMRADVAAMTSPADPA